MKGNFSKEIIIVPGWVGIPPNLKAAKGAESQHAETLPRLFSLPAATRGIAAQHIGGKGKGPRG